MVTVSGRFGQPSRPFFTAIIRLGGRDNLRRLLLTAHFADHSELESTATYIATSRYSV